MNNVDEYINILKTKHKDILNDIVNTYFNNQYNERILTYFRIYFMYYLLTSFIYKPELNINQIKQVFFIWIKETLINENKKNILKNFNFHYSYLFKIFFVEKNIYFHVYFNNLIKYFLPLPFELNLYCPIITYRANVNNFYKKNNVDYFDKINNFDIIKEQNTNFNTNEIDIHIPLSFYNEKIFSDIDVIYLVGKSDKLYICNSSKKILYIRKININENINKFINLSKNKKSFEEIFPIWEKGNEDILNFENVIYLSVMKKINNRDLFNVFSRYNITQDKYKYLFHNTQITENLIKKNDFMEQPKFFYLIPTSKSKYFKNEAKRSCVIFKIERDINNLLDLTSSIVTNNIFTQYLSNNDKKNKKWISYNPSKTIEFYEKGTIPTIFDENFKCLTIQNSNIKNRIYCDVGKYSGRSKLQEIFFKTRKFKYKKIYLNLEINEDIKPYEKYRIYHPINIPINATWDFDKYILQILNINGFFFIDYGDAVDGGELLLIKPNKYISISKISDKPCFDKNAF
jgi:hypothetical protein